MEPRRFITTFTSARHLSLSWAQLDPVHTPIMCNAVQHNLQIPNIEWLLVPYEINPLKISLSER